MELETQTNNHEPKSNVNTKEELVNIIKEWIKLDNELTKIKNELKDKNNKKKNMSTTLLQVMKNNSIDCFDINGGALVYKQRKTKKPISGKFLLEQLEKYYSQQPELAKDITKHLLDNREETIKEELKRKIDKIKLT